MSRFDENDSDDFDSPEETDSVIRELRAEIVRLEAQLDQLTASVRERTEETVVIQVQLAELELRIERLEARRKRDERLLVLAWVMVVVSLSMSLYTYFST